MLSESRVAENNTLCNDYELTHQQFVWASIYEGFSGKLDSLEYFSQFELKWFKNPLVPFLS